MRRLVRTVSLFAAVVTFAVMGFVTYLNYQIPDSFYVFDTENFSMEQLPSVQADPAVPQESPAGTSTFPGNAPEAPGHHPHQDHLSP